MVIVRGGIAGRGVQRVLRSLGLRGGLLRQLNRGGDVVVRSSVGISLRRNEGLVFSGVFGLSSN